MKLYAFDIADRLGLRRPQRNTLITKIVTDSREVCENTLFAALVGERVDGHDYVAELDEKFTSVLFLTSKKMGTKHTEFVCSDVLRALADIAALYLSGLPAYRVAVTGSVGKTTTKEMIDCVLSGKYSVQKSLANRNNELGMPLTAFSVEPTHQVAIFEMGMRGMGQIDYLARRVRPHIGVITNIGVSHMELLGSRENICKAKMELSDHIVHGGLLILNGDEPLLRQAAAGKNDVRWFGIEQEADYRATDIEISKDHVCFILHHKENQYNVTLNGSGKHLVYDALAAFAVAMELKVAPEVICSQLAAYQSGGIRQRIFRQEDILLFDDTYNAAPESMQAALGVLSVYPNRKIAVLADMLELGDFAERAHQMVGESCQQNKVDILICFGDYAETMAGKFAGEKHICKHRDEALEALLNVAKKEDIILFKGSHSMQCDILLEDFIKRWKDK